jgi:hypothetical protein
LSTLKAQALGEIFRHDILAHPDVRVFPGRALNRFDRHCWLPPADGRRR